jgi:hypothetical protein
MRHPREKTGRAGTHLAMGRPAATLRFRHFLFGTPLKSTVRDRRIITTARFPQPP